MPFIRDSLKRGGLIPSHHHTHKKDGFPLSQRTGTIGVDIIGVNDQPGQVGEYVTDREAHDYTGDTVWKRASRELNGCRFIWPCVMVGPNGETGGGPITPGPGLPPPTTPGGPPGYSTIDGWLSNGATPPGGGGFPAGEVPADNTADGRYVPPGWGESSSLSDS